MPQHGPVGDFPVKGKIVGQLMYKAEYIESILT